MPSSLEENQISNIFSLLAITIIGVCSYFIYLGWNFDDALIVYRMVDNIQNGRGWAYNVGEHLNASTSVLHTALVALLSLAGIPSSNAAHLIGSASLITTGVCINKLFLQKFTPVYSLMAALCSELYLAQASVWGVEILLFVALIFYFALKESRNESTWPLLACIILTRPDGVVLAGLKWLELFRSTKRIPIKGPLITLVLLTPWLIFSIIQFHAPLPDTLANKVWQGRSGFWGHGYIYLKALIKQFFSAGISWPLIAGFLSLPAISGCLRRPHPLKLLLLFVIIQQLVYILLNVPGYHWYFVTLNSVLLLVGLHLLISSISDESGPANIIRGFKALMWALVVCILIYNSYQAIALPARTDLRDREYSKVVDFLKPNIKSGQAIALLEVGTIGFEMPQARIVDLLGLTSRNHEYITGQHLDRFFEDLPRFVIVHSPPWHFETALYNDMRFQLLYESKAMIRNAYIPMEVLERRDGPAISSPSEIEDYVRSKYPKFKKVSRPIVRHDSGTECIVDLVNGQLQNGPDKQLQRGFLSLRGWAGAKLSSPQSETLQVILITPEIPEVAYSLESKWLTRSDVAEHFNDQAFAQSGFEVSGSIYDLEAGRYNIIINWTDTNGSRTCQAGVALIVSAGASN